ncbi:hypothetical protein [Methylosinus sp. PW1]|uniref:hypothetical protein n=1 Tax=Methylosinus sp. PW1 TaxID=107636 RepID=UPI0012EBAFF0|nr:hypothetical protein [Methylosinus sp. PW1]
MKLHRGGAMEGRLTYKNTLSSDNVFLYGFGAARSHADSIAHRDDEARDEKVDIDCLGDCGDLHIVLEACENDDGGV